MSPPLLIEQGGIVDLGDVVAIMEDSFDPAFGEAWTGAQCAGILPMRGVWLAIGREGGEALGFALARVIADEAELLLLAVRRAAQRRRVGAELLAQFVAQATARGARRVHLEVREGNPAIGLYRTHGFAEVGRRRDYYRGADGRLRDALTLARQCLEPSAEAVKADPV